MNPEIYSLIILPLLIFISRIADVSLGTLRIIFISKGEKFLAPLLGFFEVLIWLLAIQQIFSNFSSPIYYITYAAGFAAGTFAGMKIEQKLSIGKQVIQVITRKNSNRLILKLRENNYQVTTIEAKGSQGKVKILFIVTKRCNVNKILELVEKYNPAAFYTIEDLNYANDRQPISQGFGSYRKAK
jgi:uncharacterized protein YebE (UPF0316 family)